jgi:hypothetical protein
MVYSPERQSESTSSLQIKKLWSVVKELGQYVLAEGDIIKLGRFKLRVRQVCTGPDDDPVRPDVATGDITTGFVSGPEANGMPCRICLLDGSGQEEDPLVEACNCRGSIQYVHLGCLRYWINGRLCLTEPGAKHAYLFRQLSCELCKSSYPVEVQLLDGTKIPLVPMPETRAPYIVLENMMRADPATTSSTNGVMDANRGVFVISLAGKKTLKLGRGHESDVRIADVSISRWHATISFDEESGHFVLEDHSSKFGTLVAMRRPKMIDLSDKPSSSTTMTTSSKLCVQSGRTLFKFNYPPTEDQTDAPTVPVVPREQSPVQTFRTPQEE